MRQYVQVIQEIVSEVQDYEDSTAKTYQDAFEEALLRRRLNVVREYPVPHRGDGRSGRVDLVVFDDHEMVFALELDRKSPRYKSEFKLGQLDVPGYIVCRSTSTVHELPICDSISAIPSSLPTIETTIRPKVVRRRKAA